MKFDQLDAWECERLIAANCDRLKNCVKDPFRPNAEYEPRIAILNDIRALLDRKLMATTGDK